MWRQAFPDLRLTLEDMIAEGDKVVPPFNRIQQASVT